MNPPARQARVAFVERQPASSFILHDREALEASFKVDVIRYDKRPTIRYVADAVRLSWRADATYAFFASEHALLPALVARIRRRPFVLSPAGYDFANMSDRRYGLAARGRGWLPKLLARLATSVLCCSEAARQEVLALVPTAAAKTTVAYLGSEPDAWADPDTPRDERRAVTVAFVNEESWSRKGIDRFVSAALRDAEREYILIGEVTPAASKRLPSPRPPNLVVTGFVDHEQQRRMLWSAGIYVQLSWHESFGMAMLEAMMCGCVPVTSDVPALREVAGSWGEQSLTEDNDLAAIARASATPVDRSELRADAIHRFAAARRRALVRQAVEDALRT